MFKASHTLSESRVWEILLALASEHQPDLTLREGSLTSEQKRSDLWRLFGPLCAPSQRARFGCFTVAHLGQSLDAKISPPSGKPEAITSAEDMRHNHRMRAVFDAVLVGAGTVFHDNPQLTVRHVSGRNPVRVVLDPDRRLSEDYQLFQDGAARTLLLCKQEHASAPSCHGSAEVVGVPGNCEPAAVLQRLAQCGCPRVFIEGGGVTVSRFLEAEALHVLQLAVSPLIMGRGRAGIELGAPLRLRPQVSRFSLSEDILFQCTFESESK